MTDKFPDISSKLGAPTKRSLFERQKAEAEAKKAREKAETAAVYEDFVKSFDDDGDSELVSHSTPNRQIGSNFPGSAAFSAGPGKRHFTSTGLKSGPGSLVPAPGSLRSGSGSLGPVQSSHGRKRPYDDLQGQRRDRSRGHGMFSYDDDRYQTSKYQDDAPSSFGVDEEYDVKDPSEVQAAAKPTLHLSSLPPGTSRAVIRALFTPSPLAVEDVRILPPPAPSSHTNVERKSTSAIVTLVPETPATDIDTMVSHLQNKYLGFGYNLSISRHLSSAALGVVSALTAPSAVLNSLPFGARPIHQRTSLSRAPPPNQASGRFAPPASYTSSTPYGAKSSLPQTQVTVQSPSDLKQLKRIHKTLEALLTYGPEFEALLMSRPQIQRDENWAWLWDSRSTGGVYYRWRLWDILTDSSKRRRKRWSGYGVSNTGEVLFESQSIWIPPETGLRFEYITRMGEFISDDDYDSSDEEADEDGGIARRYNDHNMSGAPAADGVLDNDGAGYLNPLAKTKLVHLLARLPETNSKLRRGDVARITGFAIEHAGAGAREVTELITGNVIEPFHFTGAKGPRSSDSDDKEQDTEGLDNGESKRAERIDSSPASLVGLFVISDILSSSASAGVRHAWRYRALFESALRKQKVFETLGRMDRDLGWGKLKAEKWKRSVQSIMSLWEGWCVFPQTSHEEFVRDFVSPPLSEKEKRLAQLEDIRRGEEELQKSKSNSKWRSVDGDESGVVGSRIARPVRDTIDSVAGVGVIEDSDLDGEAMDEDAAALTNEDIDGVSMVDSSDEDVENENRPGDDEKWPTEDVGMPVQSTAKSSSATSGKRQRPRAVDMFADDTDDEG